MKLRAVHPRLLRRYGDEPFSIGSSQGKVLRALGWAIDAHPVDVAPKVDAVPKRRGRPPKAKAMETERETETEAKPKRTHAPRARKLETAVLKAEHISGPRRKYQRRDMSGAED